MKKAQPKSAAERKAAERERNREAGLIRREYFVHPDDANRIANFISRLNKARVK